MSWGVHIVRVQADEGEYFACFSGTSEQFVSPCCSTPQALASWADAVMSRFQQDTDWIRVCGTTNKVFDLRRSTINEAVTLIARLRRGVALSDQQALQVSNLYKFLEGTVEADMGADRVIAALKKDDLTPPTDGDWIDFVIDGMDRVFEAQAQRLQGIPVSGVRPPSREELIMVGRYLIRLARLAGVNEQTPREIIERFYAR